MYTRTTVSPIDLSAPDIYFLWCCDICHNLVFFTDYRFLSLWVTVLTCSIYSRSDKPIKRDVPSIRILYGGKLVFLPFRTSPFFDTPLKKYTSKLRFCSLLDNNGVSFQFVGSRRLLQTSAFFWKTSWELLACRLLAGLYFHIVNS
jgi:hypothetical protein